MGAWHFLVLSAGKPRGFLEGGGWKCQFYFYGRGDVSELEIQTLRWLLAKVAFDTVRPLGAPN